MRYGRFDDGYHQHTSQTHSPNLMAMFLHSDQSLAGVCAEFDCDRLYRLHILISLRLPTSCSISSSPSALYIATTIIIRNHNEYSKKTSPQVVSPLAGGLFLGLCLHLWRAVAATYAGPSPCRPHCQLKNLVGQLTTEYWLNAFDQLYLQIQREAKNREL